MLDLSAFVFVVVAAGRGVRAGGGLPKQYRKLAHKPVLTWTLEAIVRAMPGAPIQVVIHPDDRQLYDECLATALLQDARILPPAFGGASRQDSVRAGLEQAHQLCANAKHVLIHDAARCFLSSELTLKLASQLSDLKACIPGLALVDTVKRVDAAGVATRTVPREELRSVQTPQAFDLDLIVSAHRAAAAAGVADLTDDASVAQWAGHVVHVVEGDPRNIKLTTPEDFAMAEQRLLSGLTDVRVGQGFDVHAFADGDHVWLGGLRVPHSRALDGHSDADVALHALTDAVLGAIGDGDIGLHFPPSDPQWRGAASDRFLKEAIRLVLARGGAVAHLDLTIICEAPKVGPQRDAIRARIAEIAGLPVDRVSVKATTTEKLGFTGRREGIAAMATATVRLPYA